MVTLNTWCDIACLTFQLPHITTGSFQSHRWQSTTGSFQSFQRLQERNKPSVRWISFVIHKLVWWHLRVGWANGLQIFLWDNVNNQKYVWITLLKMTSLDFSRYSGYIWQVRWTICKIFMSNFLFKNPLIFDRVIQKIKGGRFWGHGVHVAPKKSQSTLKCYKSHNFWRRKKVKKW